MVAVVTDPDGVNLRGGPGTIFTSLAVIPLGTELPVLGPKVNEDWLPVSYQGKMGFVFDEYVELRGQAPPSPTPSPSTAPPAALRPLPSPSVAANPSPSPSPAPSPSAQAQLRVNSADGVNLRAGPSLDQRVIVVIPNNTRLTIISRSSDGRWANVTYNGQNGWVDQQFLAPIDDRAEMPTVPANVRFMWPVTGRSITTPFSPGHLGVDIDQYPSGGNPVVSVAAGKVTFAGGNQCCSYGLYIEVEHKDGTSALYAHLQSIDVREGQDLTQGQMLGRSGNTGRSTGAHLHFELHMGGGPVDPLGQLPR